MTRFARARGSKSSNKREPEEATSWSQLKDGLLKKSDPSSATARAQDIQKCKDTLRALQEDSKTATSWATFEEDSTSILKKYKSEKDKVNCDLNKCTTNDATKKRKMNSVEDNNELVKKNNAKKKKKSMNSEEKDVRSSEQSYDRKKDSFEFNKNLKIEKRTKKNEKSKETINSRDQSIVATQVSGENVKEVQMHGKKKKKKKALMSEITEDFDQTKQSNVIDPAETNLDKVEGVIQKQQNPNKRNKKKKEHVRRKPLPAPYQMDLNGEMVDVVTYDGFPIMLHEAKRLEELKKSLYAKGISNGEIKKIIKLQRRSAEKALTRARKKVCFNCRRAGHPLSECPSLNQGEGTGICFKCGSTEHSHFECKVVRKQEFKFAQCFICKEQGHISNQCPDNPRGLYPKGGACKLCGDVTHLKRFCPTLSKEEEPTIENFLEEEGTKQKRLTVKTNNHTPKIVRF